MKPSNSRHATKKEFIAYLATRKGWPYARRLESRLGQRKISPLSSGLRTTISIFFFAYEVKSVIDFLIFTIDFLIDFQDPNL